MENTGVRQVARTLDGIRKDHVERYKWAAKRLKGRVLDLGSGIGYGSKVLCDANLEVNSYEISPDAVEYGKTYYDHENLTFNIADLSQEQAFPPSDGAVAFEVIEHLKDPSHLLFGLAQSSPRLLVSVPNEEHFPYRGHAFHHRHYTKDEFTTLLHQCGWDVLEYWGQVGPESPVGKDINGRTLIAVCQSRFVDAPDEVVVETTTEEIFSGRYTIEQLKKNPPESVAIIGLGPSKHEYASIVCGMGSRRDAFGQTWAINAAGDCYDCDLVFHMDDVRIQEIRAAERPDSNIAKLVGWLKTSSKPVITSRAHPDYPSLVEMPIEDVMNDLTYEYFNSTAAWAVAFAIHIGVKKIGLFGCDFTYENSHDAEKGRGCVEFWLGYGAARGVKLSMARSTSLMDACLPREHRLYGYDTREVLFKKEEDGSLKVRMVEKEHLPTADEIEFNYDHSRHPNPLVEGN